MRRRLLRRRALCTVDEAPTSTSQPVATAPASVELPPAGAPQAGAVIGQYLLKSLLGVGGMGLVYLAEHQRLRRKVALKLLRPELTKDPISIRRFFAEARAVNEIAHENIVEITDFVDEGEHRYFVMELLRGHCLHDILKGKARLELPRAVHIGVQVAAALTAAHEAGVVHRDLKPQNIFLIQRAGDPNFVKVLDFGIAKVNGLESMEADKTTPGTFVGTPAYMAPEQLSEQPCDHRVDVYAFGALLYELVAGVRAFRGPSVAELILQQLTVTPPPPSQVVVEGRPAPEVPKDLENLIFSCLAKDPERRPSKMQVVHAALARMANQLNSEEWGRIGGGNGDSGRWRVPSSPVVVLRRDDDDDIPLVEGVDAPPPSSDTWPTGGTQLDLVDLVDIVANDSPPNAPPAPPQRNKGPIAAGLIAVVLICGATLVAINDGSDEAPPTEPVAATPLPVPEPTEPTEPTPTPTPPAEVKGAARAVVLADVSFESTPPGAAVIHDGKSLGTTPLKVRLTIAKKSRGVVFQLAGHKPKTVSMTVVAGLKVKATLERLPPVTAPSLQDGALINPFRKKPKEPGK